MPSEWLTVQEVARFLRVDPSTVRRWISQGCLSARVLPHPGNRKVYRIDRAHLDTLLLPATTTGEDSLLSSPPHTNLTSLAKLSLFREMVLPNRQTVPCSQQFSL